MMKLSHIDLHIRDADPGISDVSPSTAHAYTVAKSSLSIHRGSHVRSMHWQIRDIDFDDIDLAASREDETLLAIIASSSMIESASDVYTANLVRYYEGDAEVGNWLSRQWEPEELQHGEVLRAYIARVW